MKVSVTRPAASRRSGDGVGMPRAIQRSGIVAGVSTTMRVRSHGAASPSGTPCTPPAAKKGAVSRSTILLFDDGADRQRRMGRAQAAMLAIASVGERHAELLDPLGIERLGRAVGGDDARAELRARLEPRAPGDGEAHVAADAAGGEHAEDEPRV